MNSTALKDRLTGALIGLARSVDGNIPSESTHRIMISALAATLDDSNCDIEHLSSLLLAVSTEKHALIPLCGKCKTPCGRNDDFDMTELLKCSEDIRSLKSLLLFCIRSFALFALNAASSGFIDPELTAFFYKSLFIIGDTSYDSDALLNLFLDLSKIYLKCKELSDI